MERNGIQIPDEFAGSEDMIQLFLVNNSRQQSETPPATPPETPPVTPPETPPEIPLATPPVQAIDPEEFNRYKTERDQFHARLQELEAVKVVDTDPDTYRLSHIKANNPELFPVYASLKLGHGLKDVDLLVEDYLAENPEMKDKRNEVVEFILNKYGLDTNVPAKLNPDDATDDEIAARDAEIAAAEKKLRLGNLSLAQDVKAVQKKFNDRFEAIQLPGKPKTPDQINAEKAALKEGWKPVVDKIFETVSVVPIYPAFKEGETPKAFLDFAMTDEMKRSYSEGMLQYVSEAMLEPSKETVQVAYARFHNKFIADNLPHIISRVIKKARELTETEYDAIYHNPSGLIDDKSKAPAAVNKKDESTNAILEAEGYRGPR